MGPIKAEGIKANELIRILMDQWGGLQKMVEVTVNTIYTVDTIDFIKFGDYQKQQHKTSKSQGLNKLLCYMSEQVMVLLQINKGRNWQRKEKKYI